MELTYIETVKCIEDKINDLKASHEEACKEKCNSTEERKYMAIYKLYLEKDINLHAVIADNIKLRKQIEEIKE